jgi:hypothetical protein
MPWGEEGVTKLQYKQDSVTSWGTIGQPKNVPITKAGIIRQLRMIQGGGALTFAGATSASAMGPYNAYTLLELLGNSQQDIFRMSGIGTYWVDVLKRALEKRIAPPNVSYASVVNPTDPDYVFDGRAITAPASNTAWNWSLNLPVAQLIRSVGGEVGMIPMSTENSQLQFSFTPNALSVSGTTYTINNNSASDDLTQPYFGTNAVTIAAPTVDLVRTMYEAIQNPADFPDFSFVSQWVEETPQTYSGTKFTWKQNQDQGVLLRLIFGAITNASPWGLTTDTLSAANAIQLSYNTDTAKFKESGLEAVARQREQLGGLDFPQGIFFYDLLGPDLTLSDVLNTYVVPAIQLDVTYTSVTLNTNINPKVIAQRLLPLRVA